MKKMLVCLMALSMVASLAACGGKQNAETKAPEKETEKATEAAEETEAPAEDVELRFVWWGNQVRTENTTAAIDLYMEKNSNVSIEGQAYQWGDYWTFLATAAAGDSLADIIQQDYTYLEQFVANDDLVELTPYIESGALDTSKVADTTMATGMVDGGVYAICAGINAPCLVYNKTLLDEAGITVPDGMTMDEFCEISKEISDKTGVKTNYFYGNMENMITYFVRSMDEYDSLFSADKFTQESADVYVPYFEYAKRSIDEGWHLNPAVAAEGAATVETNPLVYFASPETQSWCVVAFSNQMAGYQAANAEIELALTPYPADNQDEANYLKPSQFFAVTTDSVDEAAAVAFVDFLTNDEEANTTCLKGERGIPVNSEIAEKVAAQADDGGITVKATEYVNNIVTPHSSPIYAPTPSSSSEVVALLGDIQEKLLYGKMTPQEAAEKFFTEGNEILAK